MKLNELRDMTEEQFEDRLKELHTEMRDLRFQEAVGNLTATSRQREIRREIARIHTIRTENANQAAS